MSVGVSMPVAVRVVMFMHMHFAVVAVGDYVMLLGDGGSVE